MKSRDGIPTPKKIRKVLDDYVNGQDHGERRSDAGRGSALGDLQEVDRTQDRGTRPAVDHGDNPARYHLRSASLEGFDEVVVSKQVVEGTAPLPYI
jgi:hypothetical protein